MRQLCKIALPHLCLYVLLCLYLFAGAWAFARIEHGAERAQQAQKLERIAELYEQIASEAGDACGVRVDARFRTDLYASLSRISQFFEGRQFRMPLRENDDAVPEALLDEVLPPRWSAMSSVLYALSILTTTGYGPATPMTPLGQWLSISYGLIGIPLTVLAAVDIGRFLSDVVLTSYDKILRASKRVSALCGVGQRTGQVISQVETKALKSLNRLQQTKPMITLAKTNGRKHEAKVAPEKEDPKGTEHRSVDGWEDAELTVESSLDKEHRCSSTMDGWEDDAKLPDEEVMKLTEPLLSKSPWKRQTSIREAIKNQANRRVILIFCLLVLIFTLLFLDWYNP